jgi:hypothetical protein
MRERRHCVVKREMAFEDRLVLNISRFREGRMVEHWALLDEASMIRQLTGK